jgi:hypothetical protein
MLPLPVWQVGEIDASGQGWKENPGPPVLPFEARPHP